MSRILAAFVVIALVVSATPADAIAPVCHRCCDQPRLSAGDGQLPPCCRISTDAPRPVACQAGARETGVASGPAVLPAVAANACVVDRIRPAAMPPRPRKPHATLRI